MIILDTNVVSEAMKPDPDQAVQAWLDDQAAETMYLTSVTLAELLFGIGALPVGRRKNILNEALGGLLDLFGERILGFDADAARCYADIALKARIKGLPMADGYIAGIAAAHGFVVATRDTAPFQAANIAVINPWEALAT